jgi:hypothetical protein
VFLSEGEGRGSVCASEAMKSWERVLVSRTSRQVRRVLVS